MNMQLDCGVTKPSDLLHNILVYGIWSRCLVCRDKVAHRSHGSAEETDSDIAEQLAREHARKAAEAEDEVVEQMASLRAVLLDSVKGFPKAGSMAIVKDG